MGEMDFIKVHMITSQKHHQVI